jgi:general secretion pathway protein A
MTWLGRWKLRFDPFRPGAVPFVGVPGHEEVVCRLQHLVKNGERRGELRGEPGIGKSTVLDEALRRLRLPDRRIVRVRQPADGDCLLRGLSVPLGHLPEPRATRPELLSKLLDSARLARSQGIGLVFAVDDDGLLDDDQDRRLLDRIEAIGNQAGARFTLIVVGRGELATGSDWSLALRVDRLSRRRTSDYLAEKLRAAGSEGSPFSDRAVLRLHAISGGIPGLIDRLAGLALRAGAVDSTPEIPEAVIEGIARECVGSP